MKTGDTLYCLDGSTVVLRYFDDEIVIVEYKGKLHRRPKSAIGKTLLIQPLSYEDDFLSPADDMVHSTAAYVAKNVDQPVHKEKSIPKDRIEQEPLTKNQIANTEKELGPTTTLDNGEIFVGRVLYDKNGTPLTVHEVHEEKEKWMILLKPAVDGARVAQKYFYYQIGRNIFFNNRDVTISTAQLRERKIYSAYFLMWDCSKAKTHFSGKSVPLDEAFERQHFESIEQRLSNMMDAIIQKYGNGIVEKAEYFGHRGENFFLQEKQALNQQIDEPYFGRIDYRDEKGCYIGKREIKGSVIEWTDERAALYYNYQLYTENDPVGLSLVRSYDIKNAQYWGFSDLYCKCLESKKHGKESNNSEELDHTPTISDPKLLQLLKLNRDKKAVHDIIRTIQSNQYQIITKPFYNHTIVLGCAGSGKTMIAYHRVRYMLRNDRSILPENLYIVSPTKALNAESDILAQTLQLDRIHRISAEELYKTIILRYGAKKQVSFSFDDILPYADGIDNISPEVTKKIYSAEFLNGISDRLFHITRGAEIDDVYQEFVTLQSSALAKELYKYGIADSMVNPIAWIKDNAPFGRLGRLSKDAQSILISASKTAGEFEKERLNKLILDKQNEVESKQYSFMEDFQKTEGEIAKKRKEIAQTNKDLTKWREEQRQNQSRGILGKLIKKSKKSSVEDYDLEIQQMEKKLQRQENELHKLELNQKNILSLPEKLSVELESLKAEVATKKEIVETLIEKNQFRGTSGEISFDPVYSFFNQFDKLFPGRCTMLTDVSIDDPIAYMSEFNKLYEKIAAFRDFIEKRSTAYFMEAVKFVVRQEKRKIGLDENHFYHFELFTFLYLCFSLFGALSEERVFFFVDEFQDYNGTELNLLRSVYPNGVFNYFGDFAQCINPKGINCAESLPEWMQKIQRQEIWENYRNAFEITEYVNRMFHMNMLPIGIHGRIRTVKSISEVPERDSEKDRVAIIYKNDSSLENLGIRKEEENKEYNFWDASDGTIAVDKVNVLTVLLAKGLEFERVIVSFPGMSKQEKYVACTRALNELYILKEK